MLFPGQDLSSQALGDQDGSGSGVHSYQSAESGEVKGHREGYPQLCPATSPSFSGQGEPKNAGSGLFGVDKQSILYHLNRVKMGKLTIDQLASALGAESLGPPGHSPLAQPSTSGLSAEHMGLRGLGACRPSMSGVSAMPTEVQGPGTVYLGIQGSGAEHGGRQGLGAEHVGLQGLGAVQTNGLGLGAGRDAQGALPSGLGAFFASPQGALQAAGVPGAAHLGQGAFQAADVPGAAHLGHGAFQAADVPGAAHLGHGAFQAADVPGAAHLGQGAFQSADVPGAAHLGQGAFQAADVLGAARPGQGAYPASGVQGIVHTGSSPHQVASLQGTPYAVSASAQVAGMQSVPQLGQDASSAGVPNAAQVGPGAFQVTGPQGAVLLGHGTSKASLRHAPQLGPSSVLGGSGISMAGLPATSQAASGIGLAIQAPTMFAGQGTQEGIHGPSVPGTSLPPQPPGTGHRESSWFNSGSTPRGKGEFEPGDRVFWELPKLGPVTEANAAVRASDWLYRSALMLRDLSSKSWLWWDKVYEAALKFYHDYQQSDPLTRGQIRPDLPEDLQHHTFARLESRAVSMLLQAVPESVSSQALATRSLSTVGLLFQILKQFQPGGLSERQELLKSLTDLSPSSHPSDAVLVLQSWFRHIARARAMQVQLPDGSLLLAALDAMAKPLLAENAQVAFRVSLNRHQLRLDYRAEIELVEAYARNLMAEFEVLSLASDPASPPKKPRVRKVREKASAPASPPKDSSPAPPSPAAPPPPKPPPAKAPMSNKPCTSWLTDAGCKYGSKCRFVHDMEAEALKGRCFACSAKDHWANNCPVKQAERQGDLSPSKAKGFPARKGEGKGKSSAGVKALDGSPPSTVDPPSASSTEPPASSNKAVILDNSTTTADLAREVTEVLRSPRLKKIGDVQAELVRYSLQSLPPPQEGLSHGLVDSGATTAVRTGLPCELEEAFPVTVQLAIGETAMRANRHGTLLSADPIQPIIPMSCLASLGCVTTWTDRGISIRHPSRGSLPVRLHNKCPELPIQLVLDLIQEYEELLERQQIMQSQARAAVSAVLQKPPAVPEDPIAWVNSQIAQEGLSLSVQAQWLHMMFPDLPKHVMERVVCPVGFSVDRVPYNRHERRRLFNPKVPTLLHLFSGEQRWSDCGHVLHVEKERGSDLLSNDVFGMLLQAVLFKSVEGAVGGSPCNTTSACRMADDGGPRQVRSREGPGRFGSHRNTSAEQAHVDEASVLWFRTLMLFLLIRAMQGPRAFLGLELPEDPAQWADPKSSLQRCPSVWAFPELACAQGLLNAFRADFDQGHYGHPRKKPTSLLTTSWVAWSCTRIDVLLCGGGCSSSSSAQWLSVGSVGPVGARICQGLEGGMGSPLSHQCHSAPSISRGAAD